MEQAKKKFRISFNAPAVLAFTLAAVIATLLGTVAQNLAFTLFSVYRAPLSDPLTYLRFFTHVFGHAGWEHLIGNLMYILILGPALEEKYGTRATVVLMAAAALVTGLVQFAFFPGTRLMGASGVAFAMIMLAPITGRAGDGIPLTFLLAAALYVGTQIWQSFGQSNVSYLAHLIGGAVGAGLGFLWGAKKERRTGR